MIKTPDKQLLQKAMQACSDYQLLYGKYPDRIGIHLSRIADLPPTLLFPLPQEPTLFLLPQIEDVPPTMPLFHVVRVEPVLGAGIDHQEVYVSMPGNKEVVMDSVRLGKLAGEWRIK